MGLIKASLEAQMVVKYVSQTILLVQTFTSKTHHATYTVSNHPHYLNVPYVVEQTPNGMSPRSLKLFKFLVERYLRSTISFSNHLLRVALGSFIVGAAVKSVQFSSRTPLLILINMYSCYK